MSSAYSFSGGTLRLKADVASSIEIGKVSKKKKHGKTKSKSASSAEAPSSKMEHVASKMNPNISDQQSNATTGSSRRDLRTPAELAYERAMAKRAEEKILKKAAKSHKEQVEEFNSQLDKLTEYNDIPKIYAMSRSMDDDFTYFVKIIDENGDQYYMKSSIDERANTMLIQLTNLNAGWIGALNQSQVRTLAKHFPPEEHDTFYSHTQRAFSQGNLTEIDGRVYVFTCKKIEKNRIEFIWKQMVNDLNSLKIIGHAELQERPMNEILVKMMDHAIDEITMLQAINQQKQVEIQRINGQLNKALDTVKQTVDMKEKLEADLYRKFVLVLNTKKTELNKLRRQIESYQSSCSHGLNGNEQSDDEGSRAGYNSETDDERSNDAFINVRARSRSPIHTNATTTKLNDNESSDIRNNKRSKYAMSDTDTSGDEDLLINDEVREIQIPIQQVSQSAEINLTSSQDNMLDLGDDRMDYKAATISKHHQRRKYVTGVNSITTRPFLSHPGAGIPPNLDIPSLPDESQTADDLLDRI